MAASTSPTFAGNLLRSAAIERERQSLSVHRDTMRGSAFPPPKAAAPQTFVHGFLLPFSLLIATLRHPTLGLAYLRITVVRTLIVGVIAAGAFALPSGTWNSKPGGRIQSSLSHDRSAPKGAFITFDRAKEPPHAGVVGDDADAPETVTPPAPAPTSAIGKAVHVIKHDWSWIVWFLGVISMCEALVVFFSRRWDDWISFFAASVARIRPEDAAPKPPKLSLDIPWTYKKAKRRARGYIVFASGLPLIHLFKGGAVYTLGPEIGHALSAVALALWGWYWLAVFTAAKSAHAWADDGSAPPPLLVRELHDRSQGKRWLAPVALYARLWVRITRGVSAAAATFERTPAPFLGLALARVVLSLPGLYLLARPIIPVAAGRLCAENDPQDRFSI